MVITKIEKQKKNSRRWNLYVDDEFVCGISEDTFLKFGLRTNDDISEETLDEIKKFDEYQFAKKSALDLLSYRIRSTVEIRNKLKSKNVSAESIEKTIKHLSKIGLLDDEEFARQLVQSKMGNKPAGKSVIRQKLFQKGIARDITEKVIGDIYTESREKALIIKVYSKFEKKVKELDEYQRRRKAFEFLMRKGFDIDAINEFLNQKLKE